MDNNQVAQEWESKNLTLAAYAAKRHIPICAVFEVTARCNLKCKMCYVRLDPSQIPSIGRELTTDEWISLGRQCADAGTINMLITGGEPLLRDDFAEIYTELNKMGFILTMNTNASMMSPKYYDLFSKYPPTEVHVTLYGADSETYENVCGNGKAFNKTLEGLEMWSNIPTNIQIRTTFIKDNMKQIDELREIANRYTKSYAINYMVTAPTRGAVSDAQLCRMNPSECFDLEFKNRDYYKTLNATKPNDKINIEDTDVTMKDHVVDYGMDIEPAILHCLASKSMFSITWDGKMIPCLMFSSPYTLPLEEGFIPAWNRLPKLVQEIKRPEECLKCDLLDGCPNCPGYFQSETGDLEKRAPYICEFAKERRARYQNGI